MICPLCSSSKARYVNSIEVEPLISLWLQQYDIDVRDEFKGASEIEFWRCSDCTLGFFAPPTLAASPALYARLDKFDWYYLPRRWEHRLALRELRGRKKVLEIGSGTGSFITMAQQSAHLDIEGLEQNERAIEEARRNGARVRQGTVEEAATDSGSLYDAICSFQVLEHVPRPAEFLDACCKLLCTGGLLILGLPDARSFLRCQLNLLDLPPHHMTRWTADVAKHLERRFPLRLTRIAYEPLADYQVEWYVDAHVSRFQRWGFGLFLHPWIVSRTKRLIGKSAIRRHLRGQTLYVSYCRS